MTMKSTVFLFGLCHCDQYPRDAERGEDLRGHLLAEISGRDIDLICEEAPPTGMTVAHCLAVACGILYRNVDPTEAERDRLGIRTGLTIEEYFEIHAADDPHSAERLKLAELAEPREQRWLLQIHQIDGVWRSMLFVCGAEHAESFRTKLLAAGYYAKIIEQDFPDRQQ
jgi:hypothetical protein